MIRIAMKPSLWLALAVGFVIATSGNAQAAECKGLAKNTCESRDDCSYVKGYSRKDGVKVSAHCRKVPGKASMKSKQKSATKASKKAKGAASKTKGNASKTKSKAASRASSAAKKTTTKAETTTRSATKSPVR